MPSRKKARKRHRQKVYNRSKKIEQKYNEPIIDKNPDCTITKAVIHGYIHQKTRKFQFTLPDDVISVIIAYYQRKHKIYGIVKLYNSGSISLSERNINIMSSSKSVILS